MAFMNGACGSRQILHALFGLPMVIHDIRDQMETGLKLRREFQDTDEGFLQTRYQIGTLTINESKCGKDWVIYQIKAIK